MGELILALRRSAATLGRGKVWLHLLWPALASLLLVVVLGVTALDPLSATLAGLPPASWLAAWGMGWLANTLALLGALLIILSLGYLAAVLLAAVVVLPLLLEHLAATEYADLARLGRDSVVAGARNSVGAALRFLAGWLLTLPLWLVPGMALILSLYWLAWLNRRTFAFDALAVHATDAESLQLRQRRAMPLLALGALAALCAYLPFVGLLAPSLSALAYIHYCLESLRALRAGDDNPKS